LNWTTPGWKPAGTFHTADQGCCTVAPGALPSYFSFRLGWPGIAT
jgi:hypothetical protein